MIVMLRSVCFSALYISTATLFMETFNNKDHMNIAVGLMLGTISTGIICAIKDIK